MVSINLPTPVKQALQSTVIVLVLAFAVQMARLSVIPGARQRRKRLAYLFANFGKPPKNLPPIPAVEELSKRVIRVLGQNPGSFTLQGTNTYLVGTGEFRVLIDTGDGNLAYHRLLKSTLREQEATLSDIIITHEHQDHVGGISRLRLAFPDVRIWKRPKWAGEKDPSGRKYDCVLENGTVIAVSGATLRAVLTPGHTVDHVALVLQEEGAIFTGDCVLGSGTAVFENLHDYVGSLRILQRELELSKAECELLAQEVAEELAENDQDIADSLSQIVDDEVEIGRLYPGHGALVQNGLQRIKDYIEHRQLREDQIVKVLQENKKPLSSDELVETIYADQNLSWILKRGAKRSVTQHLDKLQREGRVRLEKGKTNSWILVQQMKSE